MAYLGNSPLNRLYSAQAVTLGQGQTAVTVNYTPGVTLFFKNGALIEAGDYTATNGSVVTLTSPANAGDVLTLISLAQFAVANALALTGGTLLGPVTGPASASESDAGLIKLATTALAQGLTDDEAALTSAKLAAALDVTAIGRNQGPVPITVTSGAVRTNTTGKPISLIGSMSTSTLASYVVSINGEPNVPFCSAAANASSVGSIIIPKDATYVITINGTLTSSAFWEIK